MRLFISILLIAILAGLAEMFRAWWIIAVVACIITLVMNLKPGKGFLAGFLGMALLWLCVALRYDIPNQHILSQRMAMLFSLPNYTLFFLVTMIVGGLVGGLAGWTGSLIRRIF